MRQMPVEKLIDRRFADIGQSDIALRDPVNEVGDTPEVAFHCLPGITTLGQVVNVRVCVRSQRGLVEPLLAKQVAGFDTRVCGHDNSPRKHGTTRRKYCKLWKVTGRVLKPTRFEK